ncbi:hypothetical protein [Streptomyces melanogenes]|uniref:hypothetical protein n=1 Tax=Streptomyces melanogenes TaxID=67326 RepID=UPI00167DE1EE|nr:hypothetical protein [Streptomyces melanogenes]GGP89178.1 hypothetical protein GCM10010278_79550 [Streptomyces melanogenes]
MWGGNGFVALLDGGQDTVVVVLQAALGNGDRTPVRTYHSSAPTQRIRPAA